MTGNPDAACMYRTNASTHGISYAPYSERVVLLIYGVWYSSSPLFGLIAKHHSFGISFSLYPVRIGLPPAENTVTSCLANKTVQSALYMGPIPTRVLVEDGMMYLVVGKSAANYGIGSVAVSDNLSTYTVAVPTLIFGALVLRGPRGAVGSM